MKSHRERVAEARQLEQDGQITDAAVLYQQLFDADARNEEVLGRLLVIYRKQKEYGKELEVIDTALAAFEQRDKALRDKWLKAHPKAASAGRSILRQLERGGGEVGALGADPVVERLQKRRDLVEKRIKGKKKAGAGKRAAAPKRELQGGGVKKAAVREEKDEALRRKKAAVREEKVAARKVAAAARKAAAAAIAARKEKVAAAAARKAAAAAEREKKAEARRAAAEARRTAAQARRTAAQARLHPSLFIITLRYLVSLEKIDALMSRHLAYLNKHYATGEFLVSGRQVPRTGGIIITRGKDRETVERLAKADPFVKQKLASADVIEFKASQSGKGLERWLAGS